MGCRVFCDESGEAICGFLVVAVGLGNKAIKQRYELTNGHRIYVASLAQAGRIDEVAKKLEGRGANASDPRTQLAQQLRQLAERLRTNPGELDRNLAQVGAVEDAVRAQLDPANEQRAASLTSLSRALSRAATGNQQAAWRLPSTVGSSRPVGIAVDAQEQNVYISDSIVNHIAKVPLAVLLAPQATP